MHQPSCRARHSSFVFLVLAFAGAACGGGGGSGPAGAAGNGAAGAVGAAGTVGAAGAAAGTAGAAGSGARGVVGQAGAGAAGVQGTAGTSGNAGAGVAGSSGNAGNGGSSGQAGTNGAAGTGVATTECSWPAGYAGPQLGKCVAGCASGDCGVSVSAGGFATLDDFEGPAGAAALTIPLHWASRDGRNGSWHSYAAANATASMVLAAAGGGGSPDSKQAIHYSGGSGTYGATLSASLTCYDASAYDGISFWMKGTAAAGNTQIRFNVHTPVTEPVESGGVCTAGCYGHFGKMITLTPGWTRYKIPWADLRMPTCTAPTPALPAKFDPQKMILAISFAQVDQTKGFDFWVDDVTFDVDTRPAEKFGDIITEPIFKELFKFKAPLPVFTYAGLVAAVTANGQGQLAQGGAVLDRKREAAALVAQMSQETGGLTVVREAACSPTMTPQCTTYGTADQNYYGRGAIQLTYKANYDGANAAFPGISANPDLVASTTSIAYGTAVWFWMTKGCHTAMVSGAHNFGDTTRIINGALECSGGPNTTGAKARADLYTTFCAALGINPTGQLLCP